MISHSPKVTSIQDCHFNVWGPEPKNPLIQADNGTLQVTGCNFDNDLGKTRPPAPSIKISKPLKFAVITGNVGQKGVKIVNNSVPSSNVIIANNQPADF